MVTSTLADGSIVNAISQWLVLQPVWLQAPLVITVAILVCGCAAMVGLRAIDYVGARVHYWLRHNSHARAVQQSGAQAARLRRSQAKRTQVKRIVNQEPITWEEQRR